MHGPLQAYYLFNYLYSLKTVPFQRRGIGRKSYKSATDTFPFKEALLGGFQLSCVIFVKLYATRARRYLM
jgi:hypothetical protein